MSLYTYVFTYIHMFVKNEVTKAIWANKKVFIEISTRKNFAVKRSVSAVMMCVWAGVKIN